MVVRTMYFLISGHCSYELAALAKWRGDGIEYQVCLSYLGGLYTTPVAVPEVERIVTQQ